MILTKGNIKEINIESFVESIIQSGKLETLLIVVPTNRKLREYKKRILDSFVKEPVSKINIETLTTLSTKLLKENNAFTSLNEATASVLIKETVEELDLAYFTSYSKGIPFGTLDKIRNVISEYKRHGISPRELIKEADKLNGGEKKKALDIALIYKNYLQKCSKLSALELGDIYNSINRLPKEEFEKCFNKLFKEVNAVILNGFDEFTNLELKILNSIDEIVNHNLILNFDYYNNIGLFSHLADTKNNLERYGFRQVIDKTPLEESAFRNILRSSLFNRNITGVNISFKNSLHIYNAKNRLDEVDFIAKTIKLQIMNESIESHNICVAFNKIVNYSSIVRDVFSKYGIPINLTDRIHLKSSQPVIAIINLLELAENDFYFKDLSRVLTSGFLKFENIDLNNLISVATELKITRGLNNWETSIEEALSLIKYQPELLESEKFSKSNKFKRAKKDIKKISSLLLPLRKKSDKKEFLTILKKLILKLRLPLIIMEESNGKEEEFIKAVTVLFQTVEEILDLVDKDDNNKKHSLQFYIDHIKTISNWARFNIKEKSDYGVLVTSVNEIRGLRFDYLYLGGMCDGDFPTRYSPEIFFSGSYQKKEQLHQMEERYHFYQTLCTWNKKLFLSVPQNESDSELVESSLVKDLQKVFEFKECPGANDNEILSVEQLQIIYAQNKNNDVLKRAISESLIDPNELDRKTKIRESRRNHPFDNFEYNGFIGQKSDIVADYLKQYGDKQFSVSQLETFAKCPFKYYSERILKLKPLEEPTEEAEPIELGNVLHSILSEFYSNVLKKQLPIGLVGSREFNTLKNLLFEIAESEIKKLNLNSPLSFFEREKILGIEGIPENSIIYKFLVKESENETEFKPQLFEYGFGNFGDENVEDGFALDNVKLRGKIDRIDVDNKNNLINVVDYKLRGAKPSTTDLIIGLSLQLPVYLMAGQQIMKNATQENYNGYKMIIYSLDFKKGNFGPQEIKLSRKRINSDEEILQLNESQLAITREKLSHYQSKITEGKFNLSELDNREEKVCRYCNFRSFCRVGEVFEV